MLKALCSSLHVFSSEPVDPALGRFVSYSEGWQTLLHGPTEPYLLFELGKKISRKTSGAVLVYNFFEENCDQSLALYQAGKNPVYVSTFETSTNKGVFKIPGLVGYPDGYKRRISEILSCCDPDELTALLEEFFGVALKILPDDDPAQLARTRGAQRYQAFHDRQNRVRGKNSPIRPVLTSEFIGKLFSFSFNEYDHRLVNCALLGNDTPEAGPEDMRPVRFVHGQLEPIPQASVTCQKHGAEEAATDIDVDLSAHTMTFLDGSPEAYRGKTFRLPTGYYPLDFDEKQRLFITKEQSSVAVMDASGEIIARFTVKGAPVAIGDGYILTVGPGSGWIYVYDPASKIRIYRLEENE